MTSDPPTTDDSANTMPCATPITTTPKEQDYKALRPLFQWLSTDMIKCTFETTT